MALNLIDIRQIKGGIKVIHGNMDNPNLVEVDKKVSRGALFGVCLEESLIPIDSVKHHKSLS